MTNQVSEHVETQALRGVSIARGTDRANVLEILSSRGGKDPDEEWNVDSDGGIIRIRKKAADGKVFPPRTGIEFWRRGLTGEWESSPST